MVGDRRWIAAANRFGMGASPQDLVFRKDPVEWLKSQIAAPDVPDVIANAPSTIKILDDAFGGRANAKTDDDKVAVRQALGNAIRREAETRIVAAVSSKTSFVERWVWFWANHFTVSWRALVGKVVGVIAGSYEREAIRAHAFGSFRDMLVAVTKSAAMGFYLDNISSIGPNSKTGLRAKLGLNENLGRELLELHTLGVNGGYTQDDVKALAAILTGWSFGKPGVGGPGAQFQFRADRHEPGPKTLLGQRFAQEGVAQGEAALDMLAAHPSTARHVATQLARHFIADDPPASAVNRLTDVFTSTKGDLRALALSLIDSDEAWASYPNKIRSPLEFLVAAHRAVGLPDEASTLVSAATNLQQAPFTAPSPAGWPDTSAAWATPEGMVRRVEYCATATARLRSLDRDKVMDVALADTASPALKKAVEALDPPAQIALILGSPEFQRR